MIPRLLRFSVLVSYVSEVTFGSIYEQLQPIDVVRSSTVGNTSYDCFEDQYDMPLVFWHKANLESKLSLIRSLDNQDVSIKRGKLKVYTIYTVVARNCRSFEAFECLKYFYHHTLY